MARHRVGDTYLSDEEFEKHQDGNWAFALFFVGFFLACTISYALSMDLMWSKEVRFSAVMVSGIITGSALSYFRQIIRIAIYYAVIAGVIAGIGAIIWTAI